MAVTGIEILRGQLDQLKAQREQIYNEQLLPLDDAIGHLEKLVGSQNGHSTFTPVETEPAADLDVPETPAPKTRNVFRLQQSGKKKPSPAKGSSPRSAASSPKTANPRVDAESVSVNAASQTATSSRKPTVRLKSSYQGKSVDEAVVELFSTDPTKTWKTEDVVAAITSPSSKDEQNTCIRSLRLSLANGAAQGRWQKVGDKPAVYASNDYKAAD